MASNNRLLRWLGLCLCGVALLSESAAGTYKWVDEKGVTHYSDTLPPDYSKNANSEIDKRGMVKKKTERALTDAEIKAKQNELQRLKDEEQTAKEQKRLDEIMLATYAAESEVDLVRDRSLEPYDGKIYLSRERIKLLQQQLGDQNKQLAFYTGTTAGGKKKTPPPRLLKELAATTKEIDTLEKSIKDLENEKTRIVAKFADDKRRFREVKAAGGAGLRVGANTDRSGIPTWVEVRSPLAKDCLGYWQDTLGGRAYAVFAEIKRDAQAAELLLETRVRKTTGEFVNVKASCPLKSDGTFDVEGIRIKRTRYERGKDY
jgi:Domain of unknown function (DUF4124)